MLILIGQSRLLFYAVIGDHDKKNLVAQSMIKFERLYNSVRRFYNVVLYLDKSTRKYIFPWP